MRNGNGNKVVGNKEGNGKSGRSYDDGNIEGNGDDSKGGGDSNEEGKSNGRREQW